MAVLLLAEISNGTLNEATAKALTAAKTLNEPVHILVAGDGVEALSVWQEHQEKIELLFTDMVMPGPMTGLDLAVRLKKEKNSLKIIISSGYSADLAESPLVAGQEIPCLQKPYQGRVLAKLVRRCLDKR